MLSTDGAKILIVSEKYVSIAISCEKDRKAFLGNYLLYGVLEASFRSPAYVANQLVVCLPKSVR
jgi:hypothetical protein